MSFGMRFQLFGNVEDLDKAIELCAKAAKVVPDGHLDRASVLRNFEMLFRTRFQRFGDVGDLNKAAELHIEAAKLVT
jgi:hypothetical protein